MIQRKKFQISGKKNLQFFWTSGVVPGWARGGHLGGLTVEFEKSPRWRHVNFPKVSRDALKVKISQAIWAVGGAAKTFDASTR